MEKEPVVVYMEKQEKNGNVMEKTYGDSEVASVGEKIKALRFVRQLSRKQLAGRASVFYGTIYNYEHYNYTPSRKILIKIANALSVSMEFFEDDLIIPSEFDSMKFYMEVVKKYVLPCNDYNDADGRYIYADKFYNRKSSSSGASVGDKIKALRIVRGLKQVQLAEKVAVLKASISAYEKNKNMPPRERLEQIADVLSVSMEFFEDEFTIPPEFDSARFYTEVVKKYALPNKDYNDEDGQSIDVSVGDKIKALRTVRKLNKKQLAARSSVEYAQFCTYELKKHVPHKKSLEKIAAALSVSIDFFEDGFVIPPEFDSVIFYAEVVKKYALPSSDYNDVDGGYINADKLYNRKSSSCGASVGDKIKALRSVRRLTRVQLAEKVAVPVPSISAYEQNKRMPPRERLEKIADVLSVSMELFEDEFMIPSEFDSARFYTDVVKKYALPCSDYNDGDGSYIYTDKLCNRKRSSIDTSIGDKIKALRIIRRLTQVKLAEKVAAPAGKISDYERHKNMPPREQLEKIADVLSVSMAFFEDELTVPSEFDGARFYTEVVKKYALPSSDYNDADGSYINADKLYNRKSSSSGASVGDKIKALRSVRRLTQTQLAEKAAVSVGIISSYEKNNNKPRRIRLERIADVLSVSVAFFEDEFTISSEFDSASFYTEVVKKYALPCSDYNGTDGGRIYAKNKIQRFNEDEKLKELLFDSQMRKLQLTKEKKSAESLERKVEASDFSSIGDKVKILRTALGMTQDELGSQTSVTRTAIEYIEHGRTTPSDYTFVKIAIALGVTMDYFTDKFIIPKDVNKYDFYADMQAKYGDCDRDLMDEILLETSELLESGQLSEMEKADFLDRLDGVLLELKCKQEGINNVFDQNK